MQPDPLITRAGGKPGAGWCLRAQTHKVNENDFPRPDSGFQISREPMVKRAKRVPKKGKFQVEYLTCSLQRDYEDSAAL